MWIILTGDHLVLVHTWSQVCLSQVQLMSTIIHANSHHQGWTTIYHVYCHVTLNHWGHVPRHVRNFINPKTLSGKHYLFFCPSCLFDNQPGDVGSLGIGHDCGQVAHSTLTDTTIRHELGLSQCVPGVHGVDTRGQASRALRPALTPHLRAEQRPDITPTSATYYQEQFSAGMVIEGIRYLTVSSVDRHNYFKLFKEDLY